MHLWVIKIHELFVITFTFRAAGTTGWATHSIEAGAATIDARRREDVNLYVSPKENAEEQEYSITFYVKKGGETITSTTLTGIVERENGAVGLEITPDGRWLVAGQMLGSGILLARDIEADTFVHYHNLGGEYGRQILSLTCQKSQQ